MAWEYLLMEGGSKRSRAKTCGSESPWDYRTLFGLEIPICLLFLLAALLGGCSLLSDSNSAGGQPAAEQPANLPPSPGWTTIFQEYSGGNSVGSSEASVNQPPLIPELHPPLLDDDTRRAELRGCTCGTETYSVESLLAKRHQIRGSSSFQRERRLGERTYALHLKEILQLGTAKPSISAG
ncbi:hypothetical protein HAX54_022904 [Datura stramonium]|uniref:Uncharacterized protein n=1 Tax=Datura stramonium TaxID=4076 RepID=A0ABS8UXP5_DATST|nr:hypothetical protein [Datura stramonium]